MRKKEYSDEEIQNYLRDGWRFRPKKVDKYSYIVRRRGHEERGMGAFNEEQWIRATTLERRYLSSQMPARDKERREAEERRKRYGPPIM